MIPVKLILGENAKVPTYGTTGAACFDIASSAETSVVEPGSQQKFSTGLFFEIPENHVMLVFSRSGHGFKNEIRLSNCVGVIDSDYRGELGVALKNDGAKPMTVETGDRIAQAMVLPVEQVAFQIVDSLSSTERGTNGYGSTGVK